MSAISDDALFVRGFDIHDLIGGLSFTSVAYLVIRGTLPTPSQSAVLDAALNSVLDYGLEKPGTVAARFTVSANPSMAAGLASACNAVGENTLATEFTGKFIRDTFVEYTASGLPMQDFAIQKVKALQSAKVRIPGFGHPVFRGEDPRAQKLKAIAVAEGLWLESALLYEAIHAAFVETPGKEHFPINDVGVLAAVLDSLGFSPEEGTGIAILSTIPGLIAHISEELQARVPIRVIPRGTVKYPEITAVHNLNHERSVSGWPASTSF